MRSLIRLLEKRMVLILEDNIVIFDEAHNIVDFIKPNEYR